MRYTDELSSGTLYLSFRVFSAVAFMCKRLSRPAKCYRHKRNSEPVKERRRYPRVLLDPYLWFNKKKSDSCGIQCRIIHYAIILKAAQIIIIVKLMGE